MSAWSSRMALFWVYLHPLWRERSPALRAEVPTALELELDWEEMIQGFPTV